MGGVEDEGSHEIERGVREGGGGPEQFGSHGCFLQNYYFLLQILHTYI